MKRLYLAILLTACSSNQEITQPSYSRQSTTVNRIKVTVRKANSEWVLDRNLELNQDGYRLSDPITLPIKEPDEIILSKGTVQIARLKWDPKAEDRQIISFSDRPLRLEFRTLPEKLKFEWVQKNDASLIAKGKGLIGGLKVKNSMKEFIVIKHNPSGWVRVSQEERDWQITNADPCFHRSEYTSKDKFYDFQVELGADLVLRPEEERLIPIYAFGEDAKLLEDWKLPVLGPEYYIRENLFLGYVKDFPNGFPPGGVMACTTALVVTKPYDFPMGKERRPPVLSFSSELRKVRVSYRADDSVFSAQELPTVENFLGFSN